VATVPQISDAEWEVMKVLWARQTPTTANEVIEVLAERTDWNPKTVRTLLNRLVQKQAAAYRQDNKLYAYYPLVTENECVLSETETFLKRIYGGAFKPLLAHFLNNDRLSAEEIKELKHLLDDKTK